MLKKNETSLWQTYKESTRLNVLDTFPLYKPRSTGNYKDRSYLTIQTINQVFPCLVSLSESLKKSNLVALNIEEFPKTDEDFEAANDLKCLLDEYGSDKARNHNYHNVYGVILKKRHNIKVIFEVGLGTTNTDVVSHMSKWGKPGASLRAFKEFCPLARIYGADVDKRILFNENRIDTYFVDQTDNKTFDNLDEFIPEKVDLVIDDGLHSPNANIETLRFGLRKIKVGGWVVVEDIGVEAIPVWEVVASILPSTYKSYLLTAKGAMVFAVERLE